MEPTGRHADPRDPEQADPGEAYQLQKGTWVGVRISDAQLNGAIQNIAAQNRMTLEQFIAALEQQGQSYPEMREQVRRR